MAVKLSTCTVLVISLVLVVSVCEFLVYYAVLYQCSWPKDIVPYNSHKPVNALILADTHMLGPYRGHWLDKLRREWQMHRSFQSAMTLFQPQLVIFLGDLFDEGQWVTDTEWKEYVLRFHKLFHTPDHVKVVAVVGNHDIGFHYVAHPKIVERFDLEFHTTGVDLFSIEGVHFVAINSVAMQGDGCHLCDKAEEELKNISRIFKCSRGIGRDCQSVLKIDRPGPPIILQHFPMYRESDEDCIEQDSPKIEKYRETWEVLSQEATDLIGDLLQPRLAFSGHSHNYCLIKNRLGIEEYTIPSFNCRNRDNPAFALATFTEKDYSVEMCSVPRESSVKKLYGFGLLISLIATATKYWQERRQKKAGIIRKPKERVE